MATPKFCRICLRQLVNSTKYTPLEGVVTEMLEVLLIIFKLNNSPQPVACGDCMEKIEHVFEFKSKCIYTEDYLFPYVSSTNKVDIIKVFLSKIENQNRSAKELKICRLCLESIENTSILSLNEALKGNNLMDIFETYMPEVNLHLTQNPSMCQHCLACLKIYADFIASCKNSEDRLDLGKIAVHKHLSGITKDKNVYFRKETNEDDEPIAKYGVITETKNDFQFSIKMEEIHIKSDPDTDGNRLPDYSSRIKQNEQDGNHVDMENLQTASHQVMSKKNIQLCSICNFQTISKKWLEKHMQNHRKPSEKIYKCEKCVYETYKKVCLEAHSLVHKNEWEITMFKCTVCQFKTKRKSTLTKHMQLHKSFEEIRWLKCKICPYKARRQYALNVHMIRHKNPSEVEMLQCANCLYETISKSHLVRHMKVHLNPSLTKKYKCKICSFKTNDNYYLKNHHYKVTHANYAEQVTYKCFKCTYETNDKNRLRTHVLLVHSNPSDLQMFICNICEFKSKRKASLQSHMSLHKNYSELSWFKCKKCAHVTRHKNGLKRHMLIHNKSSEMKKYRCSICTYRTEHKSSLKQHMLIHSTIKSYKCAKCNYAGRQMRDLQIHNKLKHDISEIQKYKCDICIYETKCKSGLRRHVLAHQKNFLGWTPRR